jgi:putative ABC transport system permease protein
VRVVTLSWRSLSRRPLRTALTIVAIAISIAGFVSMRGFTTGVQVSVERGLAEPGGDLAISQRGAFTLSGSAVPESLKARLQTVGGIRDVTGVLFTLLATENDLNVPVIGWEKGSDFWRTISLADGRLPQEAETDAVIVGEHLAEALQKKVGDTIELYFQPFRIVGVARFSSVLAQSMAVLPLRQLQALTSRQETVSLFEVRLVSPQTDIAQVRRGLAAVAPEYAVQEIGDLARNLRLERILDALASTISLVVISLAALSLANTLLMAVTERTYEIGILGAIGWPRRRIVGMLVGEGLLMSAVGTVAGFLLGVAVMRAAAETSLAMGYLQPYVDLPMLGFAFMAALGIGALGALYPAWRAARLAPADALRRG